MAEGKAETESGVKPFRWWIKRNAVDPIGMEHIPPKDWHGWEARYDNDIERGKRTTRNFESFPKVDFIVSAMRLKRDEWSKRLGYPVIDDPTMHGGGLHFSESGSWLQIHVDYHRHPLLPGKRRALNLIAFLHREWRHEWGGALLLCDPLGRIVKKVCPEPGMIVAFETSSLSFHGVEQTSENAPPRISAAVYYLADDDGTEPRSRAMFFPNRNSPNVPHEVAIK